MKPLLLKGLNGIHRAAAHLPAFGNFRPLRGSFSAYGQLRQGRLEGEILQERQPIGSSPPGSMSELCAFSQHDHQPWPIFWTRADDARLVGRLGLWRNPSDQVCSEAIYSHPDRISIGEDKWHAQMIVPRPRKLGGAWVSLCSKWNAGGNYYHWLHDGLTRLMVREALPEETNILLPAKPARFVTETIELLGLTAKARPMETDCVRPNRYYFCSPTAMTGVRNPLGFAWLREKFSSCYGEAGSGAPVFLTRRGGARVPQNIAEIENLLISMGFEIVDCGALSVSEQIRKLSSATAIAGLHGAAMTNLLWARPETPVLEIFDNGYLNGCYEQISLEGSLPYSYFFRNPQDDLRRIEDWCERSQ